MSWDWFINYFVVPLVIGVFTTFLGIFLENKFKVSLWVKKITNKNSPCNFDFVCEFKGDHKKIKSTVQDVLENDGYRVSYDEKGYRTLLTATKKDLDSIKLRMIEEDTLQVGLDSPIQTIVKAVPIRLSQITSLLQDVKDKSNAVVESASLQVALPYHPTNKIVAPKGMKITEYRVELLNRRKVKILLSLDNSLSISSINFIDIAEAYRAIV
ncbi:MAG: hypothetical protein M1500_00520 [Candidatus Marsarchaeota archaeon]|nr:hypothetical protein [Candidatus Marsarchaeota archaeon]